MNFFYSDEKNVQVILYLLKHHSIKHVIASPGSTNTALVSSMQQDPYFIMYSSVDERSAAYMACGLAAELGEPVVISCTGATASRNYLPGLTEAYYRKLPVLAITSMQSPGRVGHHIAQVIDRSSMPNDVAKLSLTLPIVKDKEDLWDCEMKVNKAILELNRNGGGPVHINLPTTYSKPFSTKELPSFRVIDRISPNDNFPTLSGKVAVFIGSHKNWSSKAEKALEDFCTSNDAAVFCDHTSGYHGKNRLLYSLSAAQTLFSQADFLPDILIHIGEITGDYATKKMVGKEVWRISEDGEIRDPFRGIRYIFDMTETSFFEAYSFNDSKRSTLKNYLPTLPTIRQKGYYHDLSKHLNLLRDKVSVLPFSNIWIASKLSKRIPENSTIHFGILNSLRSWNFFELSSSVTTASNVGGFGIDGGLSSLVGASLANSNKLCFAVIGDLAFFYDINVLGNRHVGNNIRILLVNNGKGTEFRLYNHQDAYFGEAADEYVAAAGHFGNQSPKLVKDFATNLGYEYLSASSKKEFEAVYERFITPNKLDKPIIFEVFTDSAKESEALEKVQTLISSPKSKAKSLIKDTLGDHTINSIKKVIRK